jgi:hypothetical protein
MPSNYLGFTVTYESEPGVNTPVPGGVDVIIYDVATDADIDTVPTDGSGAIPNDTVAVSAGSEIRFRVENFEGRAFSTGQITT